MNTQKKKHKLGSRQNPKNLGVLPRRLEGFKKGRHGTVKTVRIALYKCKLSSTAKQLAGASCQATIMKQYCQFIDDGHGGHWVCYNVPTQVTGTYDDAQKCCLVTDPDTGAQYCVKPDSTYRRVRARN